MRVSGEKNELQSPVGLRIRWFTFTKIDPPLVHWFNIILVMSVLLAEAAAYSLSVASVHPFGPTEPEPECPAGPKSFLQAL